MGKYISLEDASYKFCPFIQNQSTSDKCKGTRCMAWESQPLTEVETICKGSRFERLYTKTIGYSETYGKCALIK